MKIYTILLITFLAIGMVGIVNAQDEPPRAGDWTLTFEDTFDNDEIDTEKWSEPTHGSNQYRLLDHITIEDGVARLNLTLRDEPYVGGEPDFAEYEWDGSQLTTRDTWTFSAPAYVEVRARRMADMPGFASSILAVTGDDGRAGTFNNWTHGDWHDIVSDFGNPDGDGAWHASFGPDETGLNEGTPAEWNTYGIDVQADAITWYVNGEAFYSTEGDGGPGEDAVFWMQTGISIDDADTLTHVYQEYDYVRIWQEDYVATSSEIADNIPTQVNLDQNYPNPFNPTTQISYQVPEAGHVSLNVYDMVGRQVGSLVDGAVSAGSHTVNFDASNLSSGVYIYRLVAGNQVISRKLTVIK